MTDRAYYCPYCEQSLTRFEGFTHEHDQLRGLALWPLTDTTPALVTPSQERTP